MPHEQLTKLLSDEESRTCEICGQTKAAIIQNFPWDPQEGLLQPCRTCARKRKRQDQRNNFQDWRNQLIATQPSTLTPQQGYLAMEYWRDCCAICRRPPVGKRLLVLDHWIPVVDPSCPGRVATNIIPLCHGPTGCNNSKSDQLPDAWLKKRWGEEKARAKLLEVAAYFRWINDPKSLLGLLTDLPRDFLRLEFETLVLKDSSKQKRFRPWIKARLEPADLDVERIVANWVAERKAAPKIAAAVRLYEALLQGDYEAARRIAPGLASLPPAEQNPPQQKFDPPLQRSRSILKNKDLEKKGNEREMIAALVEVTLIDPGMNEVVMTRLARKLLAASYTPADVRTWYRSYWQIEDWRGKKDERPRLNDVREFIGRVRTLKPAPAVVEEPPAQLEEIGEPLPPARPAIQFDPWIACMGQLQIQLNKSTFDTWLRRVKLVDIRARDTGVVFVATVPHIYAKDYLERNLLATWRETLADICNTIGRFRDQNLPCAILLEVEEF